MYFGQLPQPWTNTTKRNFANFFTILKIFFQLRNGTSGNVIWSPTKSPFYLDHSQLNFHIAVCQSTTRPIYVRKSTISWNKASLPHATALTAPQRCLFPRKMANYAWLSTIVNLTNKLSNHVGPYRPSKKFSIPWTIVFTSALSICPLDSINWEWTRPVRTLQRSALPLDPSNGSVCPWDLLEAQILSNV